MLGEGCPKDDVRGEFVISGGLTRPYQDRFGRHSSRGDDIELAVSKTLVVETDPRFLVRLTLGFVDGHGPAQANRKLLSRHRKSESRFQIVVNEFDARDEDFLSFAWARDDGGVQTAKPDAVDHDAGAISKLSRNVAQHNGDRSDFELQIVRRPAVQGCRVDYFDGNVFVSARISMDTVDGHQTDYVARQHVGVDSLVEMVDNAVERSQNAAFGEKFDVAFERIHVVVGLSRTECSSPSLLETGVESVEKVSFAVAAMDVAVRNHNVVRVGKFVNAVLSESQQIVAKVAPSDNVFRRKKRAVEGGDFLSAQSVEKVEECPFPRWTFESRPVDRLLQRQERTGADRQRE